MTRLCSLGKLLAPALMCLAALPVTFARSNALELVFQPFEYLDLGQVYGRYATLIDLFIYILIFVGLSQVTLGRRFPGSGGRALSIGTGLFMAIALVIAEEQLGFTLQSFGPFAAALIIALLGFMVYRFLHYAGVARTKAAGMAYLAMFFLMLGVTPDFFAWIAVEVPTLGLLLVLGALVAVVSGGSGLLPLGTSGTGAERRLRTLDARSNRLDIEERGLLRNEGRELKRRIRPIAKETVKGSKVILGDIEALAKAVRKHGHEEEARKRILEQLDHVLPEEHELRKGIRHLREEQRRMLEGDEKLLSRHSHGKFVHASAEVQAKVAERLRDELARTKIGETLDRYEAVAEETAAKVERMLAEAKEALEAGDAKRAAQTLNGAAATERTNLGLAKNIREMERALQQLLKRETKSL